MSDAPTGAVFYITRYARGIHNVRTMYTRRTHNVYTVCARYIISGLRLLGGFKKGFFPNPKTNFPTESDKCPARGRKNRGEPAI